MKTGFRKQGWVLLALALLIAGCEPIVDARGHSVEAQDLKQIVIGQSRAEDVTALLGTPNARSSYGDTIWYYITGRKETVGLFPPEITEQSVTAVTFGADGTVASVDSHAKEEGKPVVLVEKTTPTEGNKTDFLQETLGNVGRFNGGGGHTPLSPRDLGH